MHTYAYARSSILTYASMYGIHTHTHMYLHAQCIGTHTFLHHYAHTHTDSDIWYTDTYLHICIYMHIHRLMHRLIHIHIATTTHTSFKWTHLHTYVHTNSSATGPPGFVWNWAEWVVRDNEGLKPELSYPSPGIKVSNPSGLRSVIKLSQKLSRCSRSSLSWLQGDHGYLERCG